MEIGYESADFPKKVVAKQPCTKNEEKIKVLRLVNEQSRTVSNYNTYRLANTWTEYNDGSAKIVAIGQHD